MHIDTADISLIGDLQIPPKAIGFVIFAHGSGSSRRSPRNLAVADTLQTAGLATLRFDLLTPEEAATDEINTIRARAKASKQARPEEQRFRYREFERKRKAGDQLITGLSSATPGNFDSIKVKHERARARPSPHSGALSRLELDAGLSMESALVPFQRCRP